MPDEFDLQLSRWFAQANQPLAPADFQARLVGGLARSHSWMRPAQASTAIVRAISSGLILGITSPFAAGRAHLGVLAVSGAAMMIWMSL